VADRDRIAERLEALWEIARGPAGGADRPAFSGAEADAMRLVGGWAQELGLSVGVDRHGNLWGLPEDPAAELITSGSHVDTVPDGGRYDGALGTVLGLEAVLDLRERLNDRARQPALLVCAAEEAPRFGAGTVGSRLLVGTLSRDELETLHDAAGISAADALTEHLARLDDLPRIDPPLHRIAAHGEVHVATRRELRALGVVERIAAPQRSSITIRGEAGHAGEVAMEQRHDALAAAAELIGAIEALARAAPRQTVATVGTAEVRPGAVSVIPAEVRLGLDTRSTEAEDLAELARAIERAAGEIADRRGVEVAVTRLRDGAPVTMDPELVRRACAAAARRGIAAEPTWSGSGHDAQHLAGVAPALLLFVPLHGGESHTPQEGADLDEVLDAAEVLADALADG
jgi:N-carbamoyl-L-amino-acid hydrolase